MTHDFTVLKIYLMFLPSLIRNQAQPISVSWVYVTVCRDTHTLILCITILQARGRYEYHNISNSYIFFLFVSRLPT